MSEQDSGDKQHEPTQKKLDDARKKGEIARSVDLVTAGSYAGFLLVMLTLGPGMVQNLATSLTGFLRNADEWSLAGGAILDWTYAATLPFGAPWMLVPALVALLVVISQRSLIFAPTKLKPKMSKISMISNAKQKFGRSGLFEFLKSSVKLIIYSVVLGVYLNAQLPNLLGTIALEPALIAAQMGRMLAGLLIIVLIIALCIGAIDALFQHAEHIRKNRMSRKELMDELKQAEGDPHMKQQRRQRAMEIATSQMLAEVPKADVIIVNPTHYAVALKWDRTSLGAPVCVAKGVDEIAARIREIAFEHEIPIHSDPPTARALHASVDVGDEISPDIYGPVAAAIRFAERVRKKARLF